MAKKTASKKKRTAAQKRATAKMIAANKKKAASKKKSSARKKRTTRTTPRRRPTTRLRGAGGARRTNPKERWTEETRKYVVVGRSASGERNYFLRADGTATPNPMLALLYDKQDSAIGAAKQVRDYFDVYVAPVDVKFNKSDIEIVLS